MTTAPHGVRVPAKSTGAWITACVALALGYCLAGWPGKHLTVSPEYASIIWPASGLAVGVLLLLGNRFWPGILLGAFAINVLDAGTSSNVGLDAEKIFVALTIALGSTLQAVVAVAFSVRIFGRPLHFHRWRDVFVIALITGPLACVIASTIGVGTLWAFGFITNDQVWQNWVTWWVGDSIGVLVFMPIVLFNPWRPWDIQWSGLNLAGFTGATLTAILLPLFVTFFAWNLTNATVFEKSRAEFETLALESERSLIHRMDSYLQSLDGGAGLFAASDEVTATEWQRYVSSLNIETSLLGINGIGFIEATKRENQDALIEKYVELGVDDLEIRPDTDALDQFVIVLIEPLAPNLAARGLDIGFEENRRQAAEHSRDTGLATITRRILLVQDSTSSPGFLLLRPLYSTGAVPESVTDRRAALIGWVYAPFIGNRLLADLTESHGTQLHFSVYDGDSADPDSLIYTSNTGEKAPETAAFQVTKTLRMMEQNWTIVWHSTSMFDQASAGQEPLLILLSGLVLSGLFGALLLSYARREDAITQIVAQKTLTIASHAGQYRSLVESAVVGIILTDENGLILSLNTAAETVFGMTEGLPDNARLLDFIKGRDETVLRDIAELSQDGAPDSDQPRLVFARRADGTIRALDLQVNRWTAEGEMIRYSVIIRDITEERRVADALQDAEARWSFALESGNIGVYDVDLTKGTSIVSDTWKTMLGFDLSEMLMPQEEFRKRVFPSDWPIVAAADQSVISGNAERSRSEFRFRGKNGKTMWLRSDGFIAHRADDGTATRLVGTMVDITSSKHAEAALSISEDKFRSAIENAPVGMALVDRDNRVITANEALCRFLGLEPKDALGADFRLLLQLDGPEWEENQQETSDGKIAYCDQLEREFLHVNGHRVWGIMNISRTSDREDMPRHLIVQVMDISERKQIEQMKNEFVATISHELRTPLTSIRGALGLVNGAMSKEMSAPAVKLLSVAERNCDNLRVLIDDFLDLEKLASNSYSFDLKPEPIGRVIGQALEANQAYADQFNVRFNFCEPEKESYALVDNARLQQVLSNLLSNAAKFSPTGAIVSIDVATSEAHLRISISDVGLGIAPAFQKKIFQRFAQEDSSATRKKGGTGLGLNIVKQLVEGMGGVIGFVSNVGKGSTFWIEFAELPIEDNRTAGE